MKRPDYWTGSAAAAFEGKCPIDWELIDELGEDAFPVFVAHAADLQKEGKAELAAYANCQAMAALNYWVGGGVSDAS